MAKQLDENMAFEKQMMPQVQAILKKHAMHIIKIEMATSAQDTEQATDLVLRVESGSIGVRVRRLENFKNPSWRDWTIRGRSAGGNRTEIDKLRDGWGDWYFYGWAKQGQIVEYMLFDLHKTRQAGLLNALTDRDLIPNSDGTKFFKIDARQLIAKECMVVHTINGYPGKMHVANKALVMNQLQVIMNATQAVLQQVEPVAPSN